MREAEYRRAQEVAEKLILSLPRGTESHDLAVQLRRMLVPPLKVEQILAKVPAKSVTARAAMMGISRAYYYNLWNRTTAINARTARRLAELTGLPEQTIKEAW